MARTVKDYQVTATITTEATYIVPAVSPEEAEVIVEAYLEDGVAAQESAVLEMRIEDVFPVEPDADGIQLDSLSDATGFNDAADDEV